MRTMYIILSWVGWGWTAVVAVALPTLLHLQRRRSRPGGCPVVPRGTEADVRP